jgi:plastocyanin
MKTFFTVISVIFSLNFVSAATRIVEVEDNEFEPAIFTVNVGDTILWIWEEGLHTTTSTNIPSGASPWTRVMDQSNNVFIYIPTVAGSYDYHCEYHYTMGMLGHFTVIDPLGVKNISEQFVKLKSNYVNEFLTIESKQNRNIVPVVRDITGNIVRHLDQTNQNVINYYVGDLRNGIYILQVTHNNEVINFRFVKH